MDLVSEKNDEENHETPTLLSYLFDVQAKRAMMKKWNVTRIEHRRQKCE